MNHTQNDELKPPTHHSLPDLAYSYIRQLLISGRVAPDQPLRQDELANQLGISRLPVREALRRLDAEGIVVLKPRRGYFVAPFDPQEAEDAFDILVLLEERAAYLATVNQKAGDVDALRERLDSLAGLIADKNEVASEYSVANESFHATLFSFCRRAYILRVLKSVTEAAERYSRLSINLATDFRTSMDEHEAIFEAFRRGDAQKVAQLCRKHREQIKEQLLHVLCA